MSIENNIINNNHNALHQIPRTCSFYNWKVVPRDQHQGALVLRHLSETPTSTPMLSCPIRWKGDKPLRSFGDALRLSITTLFFSGTQRMGYGGHEYPSTLYIHFKNFLVVTPNTNTLSSYHHYKTHPNTRANTLWFKLILTISFPFLKKVHSWLYSMGFDKYIMTSIFHYVWYHTEYFHCPKNSVFCPFIHSPLLTLGNYWSFYCLHSFAFSRMLRGWNLTAGNLFRLVSFT